jgi:hypothetical protein
MRGRSPNARRTYLSSNTRVPASDTMSDAKIWSPEVEIEIRIARKPFMSWDDSGLAGLADVPGVRDDPGFMPPIVVDSSDARCRGPIKRTSGQSNGMPTMGSVLEAGNWRRGEPRCVNGAVRALENGIGRRVWIDLMNPEPPSSCKRRVDHAAIRRCGRNRSCCNRGKSFPWQCPDRVAGSHRRGGQASTSGRRICSR